MFHARGKLEMILYIWPRRTLLLNWMISLSTVVALVILIIPFLMSIFLTGRWSLGEPLVFHIVLTLNIVSWPPGIARRNLLAIVPYLCYLYLLTLIPSTPHGIITSLATESDGLHTRLPHDSTSTQTLLAFPLPQALTRITFMGVLILGILSGFGAARSASVLFGSLFSRRMSAKAAGKRKAGITEEDLTHAEGSLRRVRGDLEDRRAHLTRLAANGASDDKVGADYRGV